MKYGNGCQCANEPIESSTVLCRFFIPPLTISGGSALGVRIAASIGQALYEAHTIISAFRSSNLHSRTERVAGRWRRALFPNKTFRSFLLASRQFQLGCSLDKSCRRKLDRVDKSPALSVIHTLPGTCPTFTIGSSLVPSANMIPGSVYKTTHKYWEGEVF